MKVDQQTREERFQICKGCEYLRPNRVGKETCGKPIIGETVKVDGKSKKLCGCVMRWKTWIKWSKCPIGKWGPVKATRAERAFVKEAKAFVNSVEGKGVLNSQEVQALYSFHNEMTGSKKKSSSCGKCVKTALEELREWVELT